MKNSAARSKTARSPDIRQSARLGEIFRQSRIQAGLSEESVSQFLEDVSVDRYRAYEQGEVAIPLYHVYSLSNYLNVSTETIMDVLLEASRSCTRTRTK